MVQYTRKSTGTRKKRRRQHDSYGYRGKGRSLVGGNGSTNTNTTKKGMFKRIRRFILRERTPGAGQVASENAPPVAQIAPVAIVQAPLAQPAVPIQGQGQGQGAVGGPTGINVLTQLAAQEGVPVPKSLTPLPLAPPVTVASLPIIENFKYAGTVFTDGKHVLCGYQPNKKSPFISGIGGGREEEETYMQTAIRETVEELLEVKPVPDACMERLMAIPPRQVLRNGAYVMAIYTFPQLVEMLLICNEVGLQSSVYDVFPTTLADVIHTRKIDPKSEISHMALLPVVTHPTNKGPFVDAGLVQDLAIIAAATN